MIGWGRRALKLSLLAGEGLRRLKPNPAAPKSEVRFLIYHSVAGDLGLELDLNSKLLERQMHHLATGGSVIDYETALASLTQDTPTTKTSPTKASIVLTFDDGYLDFYTVVYPLLQSLNLPAILFVTTGFVENGIPYPLLEHRAANVQPLTWEMLAEMAESGLVTLGAHTHTHPILVDESADRIIAEMVKPIELFQQRLNITPRHFAYPRAIYDDTTVHFAQQYYTSAVVGGGKSTSAASFDAYRIPRIPIRRSDDWYFFLAKLGGWLEYEEQVYDWLHTLHRKQ